MLISNRLLCSYYLIKWGSGAKPPKFYKIIFKFRSFYWIIIEISSYFIFPNVWWGGQTGWGGGPWPPQAPMVATALYNSRILSININESKNSLKKTGGGGQAPSGTNGRYAYVWQVVGRTGLGPVLDSTDVNTVLYSPMKFLTSHSQLI